MLIIKTCLLFALTALAEIVGCYLPYLWLKKDASPWLLVPAGVSLAHLRAPAAAASLSLH